VMRSTEVVPLYLDRMCGVGHSAGIPVVLDWSVLDASERSTSHVGRSDL